jgi:hypothetical protein|uniref:Portal n=1 Tax=Siphoviridae sp. ctFRY1 TaxID=2827820 RepID=A0A8S5SUK6_9CAUD|nr:MAG TPA: portal [Siphoviridae sp. ctFRY1]
MSVNVDNQHPLYARIAPEWKMIRDCVAGERAVKACGPLYLPFPSSGDNTDPKAKARYKAYKQRAVFLNATARTLNALLGIAFAKPVSMNLTGKIAELIDDVDGSGMPLPQLLRGAMSEVLQSGRAGFMVDYDRQAHFDELGNVVPQTAAEMAMHRPLIKLYSAEQIINWRQTHGKDTLIVLKECDEISTEDTDDFANHEVTIWTELRMVNGKAHARRWFFNADTSEVQMDLPRGFTKTDLVPLVDSAGRALDSLPFCWCGAVDNNATPDAAPLADIASINIKHYNAEADVAEIAHIVGQPTLITTGLTQSWADKNLKGGIALGATKGVILGQNMDAKLLQAEERNLSVALCERREKQMAKLGAALVEKGSAPKTATEAAYDAQTDNSILSLIAGNVEKAFNKALQIVQLFTGDTAEQTVTLNKFYTEITVDAQLMTAMMSGVQTGTVRLSDFIKWMMAQGVIDDSQTVDQVEDDLRNQNPLPQMSPDAVDLDDDESDKVEEDAAEN